MPSKILSKLYILWAVFRNQFKQVSWHFWSHCYRFNRPTNWSHQDRDASAAQAQPETSDTVHATAAWRAGEKVPAEAIPLNRRARRILGLAEADGNSGEDLVPEPETKKKTTPRIGNGKDPAGLHAAHSEAVRRAAAVTNGWFRSHATVRISRNVSRSFVPLHGAAGDVIGCDDDVVVKSFVSVEINKNNLNIFI